MDKTRPRTSKRRVRPSPTPDPIASVQFLSPEEALDVLDRHAKSYFGLSGDEFIRLYRADALNPENSKVASLGTIVSVLDAHPRS